MFISHYSGDTVRAARVQRLLGSFGYAEVFLDADTKIGLLAGDYYVPQLAVQHSRSAIYFFLISKGWLGSSWCLAEYRAALLVGRPHVSILIEEISPHELSSEIGAEQYLKWDDPSFGERLRNTIEKTLRQQTRARLVNPSGFAQPTKTDGVVDQGLAAFRNRVERSLRLNNYELTDVVGITRGAVDFLCTIEDPIRTSKVAVSCWPRLESAFETTLFDLCLVDALEYSSETNCQLLTICHGGDIDPKLKDRLSNDSRIRLVRLSELEVAGTRYRDYLTGTMAKYRSYVAHTFVDLDATLSGGSNGKPPLVENVSAHLTNALLTGDTHFAFLLGDFGSGKTTIAERVHREVAEKYVRGETTTFPMLFYLRTLALFPNEEKFLQHQITEAAAGVPPTLLEEMRRRGDVLVILDGFDEVAANSTVEERSFYFSRIFEIAKRCERLLLSSRPTVFTNFAELDLLVQTLSDFRTKQIQGFRHESNIRELHSAGQKTNADLVRERYSPGDAKRFPADRTAVLTLSPLSKEKILSFFEPHKKVIFERHKKTPDQTYDILLKIYDLTDILTRPLLLEMFLFLLIEGTVDLDDPTLKVGSVSLYQQYIERHLMRERERSPYLSKDARRDFASAAACAMLEQGGTLEANFNAIASIVQKMSPESFSGINILQNLEKVVTDVRTCGFLKVTADDKVAFSHKSFMEFFVADTIYQKISRGEYAIEMENALNFEILQFVGGFAMARQAFRMELRQHLSKLRRAVPDLYAMNQKVAMMFSEVDLREHKFVDIDIDGLVLRRRTFTECHFDNVMLGLAEIDRVEFTECDFQRTSFLGQMRDTKYTRCKGEIAIEERLCDVEIQRSQLAFQKLARLDKVTIGNSEISQRAPAQSIEIVDSFAKNSAFWLSGQGAISIIGSRLENVLICMGPKSDARSIRATERGRLESSLAVKDSELDACCFFGYEISTKNLLQRRVSFRDWAGLLLVDDDLVEFLEFSHLDDTKSTTGQMEKVKRYRGWHFDNGQILVSPRWWRRHSVVALELKTRLLGAALRGRSFRKAVSTWFSKHRDVFDDYLPRQ